MSVETGRKKKTVSVLEWWLVSASFQNVKLLLKFVDYIVEDIFK
jgi:hypothetical protein